MRINFCVMRLKMHTLSLSLRLSFSIPLSRTFFSSQFTNPQPVHSDNPSNHCLVTLISQKMGIKTKARIPFLPPPICILFFCNTEARRHRYQATSHGGTTTVQRTQGKGCAVLHAKAEKKAEKRALLLLATRVWHKCWHSSLHLWKENITRAWWSVERKEEQNRWLIKMCCVVSSAVFFPCAFFFAPAREGAKNNTHSSGVAVQEGSILAGLKGERLCKDNKINGTDLVSRAGFNSSFVFFFCVTQRCVIVSGPLENCLLNVIKTCSFVVWGM